jgi:hypothetical protein
VRVSPVPTLSQLVGATGCPTDCMNHQAEKTPRPAKRFLMAVILRTRSGSRGSIPGSSEIGCGANVPSGDGESNWSRRYKANLEKLASGNLVQVVQVVRDLAERDASRGLSAGEKRMLARARLILLQEG